jgi:hypothetical protein
MSRIIIATLAMQPYLPPNEPDRREKTLQRMAALIDEAAGLGSDLVAFPEMSTTDGAANPWQFEPLDGPSLAAISRKAHQHGIYVVFPFLTLEEGLRYNSSLLIGRDGSLLGHYHKYFPTHGELDQGILPGTQTPVFETDLGRIGLSICFDLNYWEVGHGLCSNRAELVIWSSMWEGARQLTRWAIEFGFAMGAVCTYHAMFVDLVGREVARMKRSTLDQVGAAPLLNTTLDLDQRLLHHDFNLERLPALFEKYGPGAAYVEHLGHECLLIFESRLPGVASDDLIREFDLEPMRDYAMRARIDRQRALEGKYPVKVGQNS